MIIDEKCLDEIKITPLLDTLRLQKISDDEYFSKRYNGYISNSRLSLINPEQGGSPEKFFEGIKPTYSAAFDLGSYTHMLTLQRELFLLVDEVDKPTAKLGALADRLYPIFKNSGVVSVEDIVKESTVIDYYGGNLSEKKIENVYSKCIPYWESRRQFEDTYSGDRQLIYADPKTRETVWNCVRALESNQYIQELLHPSGICSTPFSENEKAILLDVMVEMPTKNAFTLSLKAKLDNYTIDLESNVVTVNDVKTIGKILSEMPNNITKFHYNREFAVYSYLLNLCASKFYGMINPTIKGNYLVVSTIPNYYSKIIPLTKGMYIEGFNEFKYLLRLVAYYYSKGYRFS